MDQILYEMWARRYHLAAWTLQLYPGLLLCGLDHEAEPVCFWFSLLLPYLAGGVSLVRSRITGATVEAVREVSKISKILILVLYNNYKKIT